MAIKYIMQSGKNKDEFKHATTRNKKETLIKQGWKHIITIDGWNVSISYINR